MKILSILHYFYPYYFTLQIRIGAFGCPPVGLNHLWGGCVTRSLPSQYATTPRGWGMTHLLPLRYATLTPPLPTCRYIFIDFTRDITYRGLYRAIQLVIFDGVGNDGETLRIVGHGGRRWD